VTFQPVVPLGGLGGWTFLTRTLDAQQAAFRDAPALSRDVDHFRERIASVRDAQTLVADRQLLRVALGAFGLDDDIDNRFFIRRVLEDGSADPAALGNRLADKRYLDSIIDQCKNRETKIAEAAYQTLANYGVAKGRDRKAVAEELMTRLEAEYPWHTAKDASAPGEAAIKRWETLQMTIVKSMQAVCHEPTINSVPNWREWWKEMKDDRDTWRDKKTP